VHAVAREKAIRDPPWWVKHSVGLGCSQVGTRRGKRDNGERERGNTWERQRKK